MPPTAGARNRDPVDLKLLSNAFKTDCTYVKSQTHLFIPSSSDIAADLSLPRPACVLTWRPCAPVGRGRTGWPSCRCPQRWSPAGAGGRPAAGPPRRPGSAAGGPAAAARGAARSPAPGRPRGARAPAPAEGGPSPLRSCSDLPIESRPQGRSGQGGQGGQGGAGRARRGRAGQFMACQGRLGQIREGMVRAGHGRALQNRSGQVRTGQGRSGLFRAGQGRSAGRTQKLRRMRYMSSAVYNPCAKCD